MSKSDVDWFPCLNLGHDKVSISSLQAANERIMHTELRQRKIEEASASTSRSAEIETLVNEEKLQLILVVSAIKKFKLIECYMMIKECKQRMSNWCCLAAIFYFDELFANRICEAKKAWRSAITKHTQNNNGMLSIKQLVPICST